MSKCFPYIRRGVSTSVAVCVAVALVHAHLRAEATHPDSHWYSIDNPTLVQAWTSVLSLIVAVFVALVALWYTVVTRQLRLDTYRQFGVSIAPQLRITGVFGRSSSIPSSIEPPPGAGPPVVCIMNEGSVAARPLVVVKLDFAPAGQSRYAADFGKAGLGEGEELTFFLNKIISYDELQTEFALRFGQKELWLLEKYVPQARSVLAVYIMDRMRQVHVYTWQVRLKEGSDFELLSSWEEDRPYLRKSRWV